MSEDEAHRCHYPLPLGNGARGVHCQEPADHAGRHVFTVDPSDVEWAWARVREIEGPVRKLLEFAAGLPCTLAYCRVAGEQARTGRLVNARVTNAAGASRDVLLPMCEACEQVLWSEPLLRFDVSGRVVGDDGEKAK